MLRVFRTLTLALGAAAMAACATPALSAEISGDYLETRTCDIFTGPCFANSEVGLTGQQAILAWSIDEGSHNGVDLAGLKVVLAVSASDTLGYGGGLVINPDPIKSVVLVDERATSEQQAALVDFVRLRADKVAGDVVRVDTLPIEMSLNHVRKTATLSAGDEVSIVTRAVGKADCCCTNEIVFYPPLTEVDNSAPAFALDGKFNGRGLGVRWSHPKSRSAFLATFAY
jgi:hypothetical protein